MSAGLALGSRHVATPRATEPTDQTGYVPSEQTVAPVACPEQMHETARRLGYRLSMTQVLRVRAASTGTTVWICTDETGRLFYQANRGGSEKKWIEGKTALFLPNVVRGDNDFHVTAPDGNTFSVNEERLEVVIRGQKQTSAVVPE